MHDKVSTESQVERARMHMHVPTLDIGAGRVSVAVQVVRPGRTDRFVSVAFGDPTEWGGEVPVLHVFLRSLDQIKQIADDLLKQYEHRRPEWEPQEDAE